MSGDLTIELELKTEEAEQRAAELKAAVDKIGTAGIGTEKFKEAAAALAKMREEAEKLRGQLEATGRARSLFLQGVGGEELPEKIGKISEAFKIAGDGASSLGTRAMALVGGFGLVANAAGPLLATVGSLVDYVRRADAAQRAHEQVLTRLGPAYGEASAAARGLATAEELLATRQSALTQHVELSAQEIGRLTVAMRAHAQEVGGNATQAQQAFLTALQQQDTVGLARFGVRLSAADLAARNHAEAIRQTAEAYRTELVPSEEVWARAAEQSAHTGRDMQTIYRELRAEELNLIHTRRETIEATVRVAEADREAAQRAEAARAEQARAYAPILQALEQLRGSTYQTKSAEEEAANTLAKHADAVQQDIAAMRAGIQPLSENASWMDRLTHAWAEGRVNAGDLRNAEGELARTQQLLRDSAHSAASLQRDLNFQLREGETAQQRYNRRLEAAITLTKQHREERLQDAAIAAKLRSLLNANEADMPVHGASGGMDPASIRELNRTLDQIVMRANEVGAHIDQITARPHERLIATMRRQVEELERHHIGSHERVIKHRGELEDAYLQRRMQAVQTAIQQQIDFESRARAAAEQQRIASAAVNLASSEAELQRRQGALKSLLDAQRHQNEGLEIAGQSDATGRAAEERYRTEDPATARMQNIAELSRLQQAAVAAEVQGNEKLRDSYNAQAAAVLSSVQAHDEQVRAMERSAEAATRSSNFTTAAWESMSGAMQQHLAALAQGKEDAATAFAGMAKDALQALSTRAIGEALANLAGGFAALASYQYPSAASFFTAAALWGAVGALSGGISAAIPSPQQAAAKGEGAVGSAPRAASAVPPSSGNEQRPQYTINYYSGPSLHTREEVGDELRRVIRDLNARDRV